jgi:hypothetical protein
MGGYIEGGEDPYVSMGGGSMGSIRCGGKVGGGGGGVAEADV